MSELVFGINGGGTFSRMRVERGAVHLGTFHSAGINICVNSAASVEQHIVHLFEQVQRRLGIAPHDYWAGCIGSAGVERGRSNVVNVLRAVLRNAHILMPVDICSDAEILLLGCCGELDIDGSILIAGTGSIALAKSGATLRRFGGHGHVLGDEGSAYWLAVRMFSKLLLFSEEKRRLSPMLEALLHDVKEKTQGTCASMEDVMPYVYSRKDKADIARHAAVLIDEVMTSDATARDIAQHAARELHALFCRMRAQCPDATARVFVDGGVFENAYIFEQFSALCQNDGTSVEPVGTEEAAERGACMLARKAMLE